MCTYVVASLFNELPCDDGILGLSRDRDCLKTGHAARVVKWLDDPTDRSLPRSADVRELRDRADRERRARSGGTLVAVLLVATVDALVLTPDESTLVY